MAAETINEVVYEHLLNNVNFNATFDKLAYIINESTVKNNYGVIFMVDDPKDYEMLCPDDQGQARFQCETYNRSFMNGINARKVFQEAMRALEATVTDDFNVWKVRTLNISDPSDKIQGLFAFSFECIVYWELDT